MDTQINNDTLFAAFWFDYNEGKWNHKSLPIVLTDSEINRRRVIFVDFDFEAVYDIKTNKYYYFDFPDWEVVYDPYTDVHRIYYKGTLVSVKHFAYDVLLLITKMSEEKDLLYTLPKIWKCVGGVYIEMSQSQKVFDMPLVSAHCSHDFNFRRVNLSVDEDNYGNTCISMFVIDADGSVLFADSVEDYLDDNWPIFIGIALDKAREYRCDVYIS